MSHNERVKIGELWLALAMMYGKELGGASLSLMLDAISDLPPDAVIRELQQWPKLSKSRTYPLPVEIREKLQPVSNPKSDALGIAKRIETAIKTRGYTWIDTYRYDGYASFDDAVLTELGIAAVKLIEERGGWLMLHDEYFESGNPTAFTAQLRDQLEPIVEREEAKKVLYLKQGESTPLLKSPAKVLS